MVLKQVNRLLALQTVLGDNELLLTSFTGREQLSRLFEYHLEMISDDNAIQAREVVGRSVTFAVRQADDSPRYFHGYISRFFAGDEDEKGRRTYSAVVVPWLWFLTLTSGCRIFQNLSVPEIIRKVFEELGFTDFDDSRIRGAHPQHDYRVQYRETSFNFVSRLAEEEGIFYFFQHENGKHMLILADHPSAYLACAESTVDYPTDTGSRPRVDHITSWDHRYDFHTGRIAQTDYNFETPSASLLTSERTMTPTPGADKYELYDYPGNYPTKGDGRPLARIRMEEIEAAQDVVSGSSSCRTFSPGCVFRIGQHKSASEEGKSFLLTSVEHSASETMSYETGRQYGGEYRNSFTCIPATTVYRPARLTPRPFVRGPQTAVVVGPAGENIYPDRFGRVKVQFFWDRDGQKNENSSCWVRVSQNWAGQSWGGMFVPHVGQEVVVDFLEGDPDRPIVTGRVYNAEQTVPLELPANKTKCILRDHGDNQMIWEGKPGEQYLHIQQQCGNELLMNGMTGRESVQLRDKFGSEIFMDSVGGTMRLSSPSHNSTIILGNSIYQQCDSSNSSYTRGDTINVHRGLKHDVYRGFRSQTDIGGYYEAMLGWKSVIVMGSSCNATVGSSVGLQYAKEVNLNVKDYVQHSAGAIKMDSDEAIGLVGGAGDASKAILGQDSFTMAYKHSEAKGRPSFGPAEIAGLIVGLGGHAAMAVNGVQMDAMKEKLTAKIEKAKRAGRANNQPQDDIDREVAAIAKEWTNTNLSNWSGELAAGIGAVAGIVAAKLSNNPSKVEPHQGAEGEIRLHKGGASLLALARKQKVVLHECGVVLESEDADIELKADKSILLETKSANITISGKVTEFGKTKIKQKNLLVD